jgi:thiamine kinase-like enzyme
MTRLPGEPLAGPVTSRQLDAIAFALDRVHHALPTSAVSEFDRIFLPEAGRLWVRQWAAADPDEELDALLRHVRHEALMWLDHGDVAATLAGLAQCQVFAQGDGNLANFIWDGDQVRVVDFEDCGPRSRAQELADFTEHLTVWAHAGIDAEDFLGRFDLSRAERHEVLTLRRLIAIGWLIMLLPGGPASHRNPAGTLQRAAGRVLELLG